MKAAPLAEAELALLFRLPADLTSPGIGSLCFLSFLRLFFFFLAKPLAAALLQTAAWLHFYRSWCVACGNSLLLLPHFAAAGHLQWPAGLFFSIGAVALYQPGCVFLFCFYVTPGAGCDDQRQFVPCRQFTVTSVPTLLAQIFMLFNLLVN